MANPKSSAEGDQLSPEQQKFQETKDQQRTQDAAAGQTYQGDNSEYLKSGRQQKEEKKAAKQAAKPPKEAVSRREFLNYAWGAALGVVLVEAGIAGFLFTVPRFKAGEFGGLFNLGTFSSLPPAAAGGWPADFEPGRQVLDQQRRGRLPGALSRLHAPGLSVRVEGSDLPL